MRLFGLEITRAAPMSPVWDNRGGWSRLIREPFTGAWQRNQEWTRDSVLAHSAVYSCVTRIAQDMGKLTPLLQEKDSDGIWSETESPAFSHVLREPNRFQNPNQFLEWWATSRLTHGNTYVLLRRDGAKRVDAMYVLDPTRVTVMVSEDGDVFYELRTDHLSELQMDRVAVPASEIIHDRINCLFHPLVGTSPIFACGNAAEMGLRIERNSSSFFENGSTPSGILSSPINITPAQSDEMSALWNAQFAAGNSGRVAVLGNGMKFEVMRMTAVDSQMIEHLRWTAEQVCSAFHVPVWKIGSAAMPAYTNPEIANQTYYSDCLQSPIEHWQACMNKAFGFNTTTEGRWLRVKLDLDDLMKMDKANQVKTLVEGIRGGLYTPNGARLKIDEKPVHGGDTIWLQQQDVPIEVAYDNALNPPAPAPPALSPGEPEAGEATEDEEQAAGRAGLVLFIEMRARSLRVRTIAA